jgi:DNA ligase-1
MDELKPLFSDHPDAFLDGEFFNFALRQHLNRLTNIVNVMILPKHLTPELLEESKEIVQLHLFDGYGFNGITKDTPYLERHAALTDLIKEYCLEHVFVLDYKMVATIEELDAMMAVNLKEGGEGLMIRYGDCPHKDGKSSYMLKYKHFDDDEFEVVDMEDGNGAWAGCVKLVICKLNTPATNATKDKTFGSNIEGSQPELREIFKNKKDWIGKMVTVKFQHYSEYGIPQLPYVLNLRTYE